MTALTPTQTVVAGVAWMAVAIVVAFALPHVFQRARDAGEVGR
jgi:hypothetical protein